MSNYNRWGGLYTLVAEGGSFITTIGGRISTPLNTGGSEVQMLHSLAWKLLQLSFASFIS